MHNRNGINSIMITKNNKIIINYQNSNPIKPTKHINHKYNNAPIFNFTDPEFHPYYKNTDLHTIQSITKSIVSILFGIAIRQKLCDISLINETIKKYFQDCPQSFRQIKIKHLLTMTSGIHWNFGTSYNDPENETNMMEQSDDWIKYILNKKVIHEPGLKFDYKDCDIVLFANILEQIIGDNLELFADKYLFKPLNIAYYWKKMQHNQSPDPEGGLYLSVDSLYKIGTLLLNKGKHNDKRIISKKYMQIAFRNHLQHDNFGYGYYWWLKNDCIFGWGYNGQYLFILPNQKSIGIMYQWLNKNEIEPNEFYNQIIRS